MSSNDAQIPTMDNDNEAPDFTVEDLTLLKEIFLRLEKAIDETQITAPGGGDTFPGGYIFGLLEKANVKHEFIIVNGTVNLYLSLFFR